MPYKDPLKQKQAQMDSYLRRRKAGKVQPTIQARRATLLEYIHDQKRYPCMDCEKSYPPCVMEFDHVRGAKKFSIGRMANQRRTESEIDIEIAKCDLVCANCHRIRHM